MPWAKTRLFLKLDKYASNSRADSILICMRYSQTFGRGKPHLSRGWFDVRRGRKPTKRQHLTGIPLRSILEGEPLRSAQKRQASSELDGNRRSAGQISRDPRTIARRDGRRAGRSHCWEAGNLQELSKKGRRPDRERSRRAKNI